MIIRELTAKESWSYFRDLGQRGFLAEKDDAVVGWVGFNSDEEGLFVHSMFCADEGLACASLAQALIHLARDLGIAKIRFAVDVDNPHFLQLVDSGRAFIQTHVVVLPVDRGVEMQRTITLCGGKDN